MSATIIQCPICSAKKEESQFQHEFNGILTTRLICNQCSKKLSTRLDMLTNADMAICQQLGLNFMNVTDYEAKVRKEGKFHREGVFI